MDPSLSPTTVDSNLDPRIVHPEPGELTQTFIANEWIGCGLQWRDDFPPFVITERNRARSPPQALISALIPESDTPVSSLSPFFIHPQSNAHMTECPPYSHAEPTVDLSTVSIVTVRQFLIPLIPHAFRLSETFNDAWLSGAQSITLSPSERLPMWCVELLKRLNYIEVRMEAWSKSINWLRSFANQDSGFTELIATAEASLVHIPYHLAVPGFSPAVNFNTVQLPTLLSNEWLHDEHINAGAELIMQRMDSSERTRIANCYLIPALRAMRSRSDGYNPRHLSELDRLIHKNELDILYIPYHNGQDHWTLIQVDLQTRQLSYGDSLHPFAVIPRTAAETLNWWLEALEPLDSTLTSRSYGVSLRRFPYPIQKDGNSCGVVVLSTLAHLLLGTEPWTPEIRHTERINWFLRLSEHFHDKSGIILQKASFTLDPISVVDTIAGFPPPVGHAGLVPPVPCLGKRPLMDQDDYHLHTLDTLMDMDNADLQDPPPKKTRKLNSGTPAPANGVRCQTFRSKILVIDPYAQFDDERLDNVFCSACAKWVQMRGRWCTKYFKGHRNSQACRARQKQQPSRTLQSFGFVKGHPTTLPLPLPHPVQQTLRPCPALSRYKYPIIDKYLYRSPVSSGGAPSRSRLAQDLGFPQDVKLTPAQEREIARLQEITAQWNDLRCWIHQSLRSAFGHFATLLSNFSSSFWRTIDILDACRQARSRSPRFAPGISSKNVNQLSATLTQYGYMGPIALSWDDTELEPALSVLRQTDTDTVLVVGEARGVLEFSTMEEVEHFLEEGSFTKADKVRLYLATIPLPRIPPIPVALVARKGNMSAEELFVLHQELVRLLAESYIYPVSMACDGTETERKLQRLIHVNAAGVQYFSIENSFSPAIVQLEIPTFYDGRPAVLVQDSKHARKTARNQLQSGARFLVFANFFVVFSMIYHLACHSSSPLFKRDVVATDKQDDRAAARIFSSQFLEFQMLSQSQSDAGPSRPASILSDEATDHPPRVSQPQIALTLYLFFMGELMDAWQNRWISHLERAKMVLRARFFLMAWRSHIDRHPDYSPSVQFISRESFDIFMTLCDSLLALICVYRNRYPTYPLLPWLHSTEGDEHFFGLLRILKKDLLFYDVIVFEPKWRVLILGEFGNLTPDQQARATGSGMFHTYYKADDLDLVILGIYPTDKELHIVSDAALSECSDLAKAAGMDVRELLTSYKRPDPYFREQRTAPHPMHRPQTLAEILELFQRTDLPLRQDEQVEVCEFALASEQVDQSLAIESLPDSCDAEADIVRNRVQESLISGVESRLLTYDPSPISFVDNNSTLISAALIRERARHQPKETALAVRQKGKNWNTQTEMSLRDRIHNRLKSIQDSAASTSGVGRRVRHEGVFSSSATNSRSVNKETVMAVKAQEFGSARTTCFSPLQALGLHDNLYCANVLPYRPLCEGSFILFLKDTSEILLGEVMALYSKPDYRGAKYESISSAAAIGHLSNTFVKVYSPLGRLMCTTMSCSSLNCATYLKVNTNHILFSFLPTQFSKTQLPGNMSLVQFSQDVRVIWDRLEENLVLVVACVDALRVAVSKRSKKVVATKVPSVELQVDTDDSDSGVEA
ncbi:hypothetical protein VNI00_018575 [Paramarasmius palmivorus]|uniref:Ubiquitin-like protease family profile domain-containing protein n=1 Tax=Paramarasmius palmivorus TaxID=297713 RepID=A0AAW0AWB6_9AGAR